jgi:hypothetical protein
MAKTDVAVAQTTDLSSFVDDEMLNAPSGFENVTSTDVLVPRITILQKLSPQLEQGGPSYIPGAAYGDLCDVGTSEAWKELVIVPVYYAMHYIRWGQRGSGKGLIENYLTDASILRETRLDDKHRNVLPDGSYIAETATYYVLNLSADGRRSYIPMTSTQLKHSRKFMTALTSTKLTRPDGSKFTPPMFYKSWVVTTTEEKNDNGSWKSFKFTPGDPINQLDPSKNLLREVLDFQKQCIDGNVSGDMSGVADEGARKGDEVPF